MKSERRLIFWLALLFHGLVAIAHADPPAEISALKAKREQAISAAMKPIDVQYQQSLVALKATFTKAGNPDAALAVDAELKNLAAAALGLAASGDPKVGDLKMEDLDGTWISIHGEAIQYKDGKVTRQGQPMAVVKILDAKERKIAIDGGSWLDNLQVSSSHDMMVGKNGGNGIVWWKRAKP